MFVFVAQNAFVTVTNRLPRRVYTLLNAVDNRTWQIDAILLCVIIVQRPTERVTEDIVEVFK